MNKTTYNSFVQGNKFKSQNENNEVFADYNTNNQIVNSLQNFNHFTVNLIHF